MNDDDVVPWQRHAACIGHLDDFFPKRGKAMTDQAVIVRERYCDRCPVYDLCLDDVLELPPPHGIWAGFTPTQIVRIRRRKDRQR